MNDQPSSNLQKTLALFDVAAAGDDTDVNWFVGFLAGRDWTTAEELLKAVGKDPTEDAKRWIRSLSDRSNGRVLGFSKGYKLTKALTPADYEHWRNTTLKATRSIRERVLKTDQVFGYQEGN